MAQVRAFNIDEEGKKQAQSDTALAPSRGVGSRAASFMGGDVDPVTGNLMPGTAQQASRGFTVTGSENPAPPVPEPTPVPEAPSRISQIQPDTPAAPAPAPVAEVVAPAPMVRNDKSNVVEQVGKWFGCYGFGVLILMEDGRYKEVQDIKLGERVALGGEVIACGKAKGDFTFVYKGQPVNGRHAVFEDGRFIRVSESKLRTAEDAYRGAVYPIVTEHHLMVTQTHIAADFSECDFGQEMTSEKRIETMNGDSYTLDWLKREDAKRFAHVAV